MIIAELIKLSVLCYCFVYIQQQAFAFVPTLPARYINSNIKQSYTEWFSTLLTSRFTKLLGHTIDKKNHERMNDINEARQQFEKLIGPLMFDIEQCNDEEGNKMYIKPHLLTNAGRKRRELEIQLLQSLEQSTSDDDDNEVIDELMSLWIHECPCKIVSVDTLQFLSSPSGSCTLYDAEATLRSIINDTSIELWPEPAARLAFVLYQQERYAECEFYINSVLHVKPWHFEMIQLKVILELSYYHHFGNAVRIARSGLPPLSRPKQRTKWVQEAVRKAQNQLQILEEYTTDIHTSNEHAIDQLLLHIDYSLQSESTQETAPSIWQ